MHCTCQSVAPTDAQAHGKQRERVDEVHAEVKDALEQHHHQPELHNTQGHAGVTNVVMETVRCGVIFLKSGYGT